MTALKKYDRIEASGLWRPTADSQRRDVVATLGDATLTIKATNDQALAHWSLAAIERANPGKTPARFHPDGDPGEELELGAEEVDMVDAIETLRRAIDRARPRPGRVRWVGMSLSTAAVVYASVFWLPGALIDHTLRVVPNVARAEIGQSLFNRIQRVTGPACGTTANNSSLSHLGTRLKTPHLAVMRGGIKDALHLPGGQILLARQLVEDHEEPDVIAGYILTEVAIAGLHDPLRDVLEYSGTYATFRLLTTGRLDADTLDEYGEHVLTAPRHELPQSALLTSFEAAGVRSTPFAYAQDITGETVLNFIEADPMRDKPISPLLDDADWLRLQDICGS
ncbi:MAG: hypothetical protein ABJL99_23490 [Aliishimia sp.]